MNWALFMQHLISGFIPMIPVLLLCFIIMHIAGKKQSFLHIVLTFVFCFYLFGILTMTGIWWFRSFSPRFVWIPFVDMIRGPKDTVLNVLLFIPLGFFLPILYEKFGKFKSILLAGFLNFSIRRNHSNVRVWSNRHQRSDNKYIGNMFRLLCLFVDCQDCPENVAKGISG